MNITLRPLQPTELNLNKFKAIYEDSFPVDERRPWIHLEKMLTDGHEIFKAFAIFDSLQFVGFITVWDFPETMYVEHFATDSSLRGAGIGSKALYQLTESATKPIVLEVEPGDTGDTARRRINFYRRHGFRDLPDYKYIQPPYSPELSPLPMTLMIYGDLDPDIARQLLYKHVYEAE